MRVANRRAPSPEVSTRQKEIQYSSRTRAGTDNFKYVQRLRRALADLFKKLPEDLQNGPEAQLLQADAITRSTASCI